MGRGFPFVPAPKADHQRPAERRAGARGRRGRRGWAIGPGRGGTAESGASHLRGHWVRSRPPPAAPHRLKASAAHSIWRESGFAIRPWRPHCGGHLYKRGADVKRHLPPAW